MGRALNLSDFLYASMAGSSFEHNQKEGRVSYYYLINVIIIIIIIIIMTVKKYGCHMDPYPASLGRRT